MERFILLSNFSSNMAAAGRLNTPAGAQSCRAPAGLLAARGMIRDKGG
ncbi:MAG TPA: hypothetical protein VGN75_10415 [Kaistia sp.]|nr:hypothetical protein [Kaistia sp.]